MGGLGNQMFQYAFGRALSIKKNTEMILDISFYEDQSGATERNYELDVFNIKVEVPPVPEIKKIYKRYFKKSFKNRMLFLFNPDKEGLIYNEISYSLYSNKNKLNKNIYLNGYFQSEKYFGNIKSIIREDFVFKDSLGENKKELLKMNEESNSVSIHIRRGDYLSNIQANKVLGLSTLYYYKKALCYINNHVKNPNFIVLSDDIEWTKKYLIIDAPTEYVSNKELNKNHEDMYIMSLCKHNIIANSSFSWWGAWLNENTEKIVIAPEKWFKDKRINKDDLIPRDWILL